MSNNPPKTPRVSPTMAKVLNNLYEGKEPWAHIRGQSQHGGANSTCWGLVRRGWIKHAHNEGYVLTDDGREIAGGLGEMPPSKQPWR